MTLTYVKLMQLPSEGVNTVFLFAAAFYEQFQGNVSI